MYNLTNVPNELISTIYTYKTVTSTSDIAKHLSHIGEPSLIIAERQSQGRGQYGRTWHGDPSGSLMFSLLLYPEKLPEDITRMPIIVGEAVQAALHKLTNSSNIKIKFPNDLLINNKKVCGILCESSTIGGKIRELVIGIGINVSTQSFPDEIADIATSLYLEYGVALDKSAVLSEVLKSFAPLYDTYCNT